MLQSSFFEVDKHITYVLPNAPRIYLCNATNIQQPQLSLQTRGSLG